MIGAPRTLATPRSSPIDTQFIQAVTDAWSSSTANPALRSGQVQAVGNRRRASNVSNVSDASDMGVSASRACPVGQSDVTALLVRECFGGELRMAQVFQDGQASHYHYWNYLPNGIEVDLTVSQFDGGETFGPVTRLDDAFLRAAGPINEDLASRLKLLRSAVRVRLKYLSGF